MGKDADGAAFASVEMVAGNSGVSVYTKGASVLRLGGETAATDGNLEIPIDRVFRIGEDVDGAWRLDVSGSQLLIQQKQSGSWVTISTFTGV